MTADFKLLTRKFFTQDGARSRSGFLLRTARRSLLTVLLLLTAHCSLLTVFAQPGVPPLTSPLYGARTKSGSVSTGLPPILKEVGIDQRLNESLPLDAVFKDDQGREVRLGEYFKGKPVVLALVYYSCPRLCNQILIGTLTSVRQVSFNAGEDYQIVAISFDSRETPQLAAAAKQTYVKAYNRANANAGWHFLTGDDANIKRVTDAVGFRYQWDDKTNQFAHASGIFVTTPEGKLARYFYGIEYPHHWMRLALVEASENHIGTPVDTLMLYCYHYDPATGKYGASVMNGMKVAGVITVGLIVGMLLKLRRRGTNVVRAVS
ncbi:MAG TPA: SCO family protein [Pyrinomonadaceae bacterium]|nr:SCO family protein [Pyrinomonadaceae bacterium]